MTAIGETPIRTLADLLDRLGDVPLHRVRFKPPPGTATEADVLEVHARENRLCELVDGVLVEKAMGYQESVLAGALIDTLRAFVKPRRLGLVSSPDGMMRLFPGLVRIPDVAYTSWNRIPGRRMPAMPIPDLVPDLAIEVLSKDDRPGELLRKRREYFDAGVRAVWQVDGRSRTVAVFTAPEESRTLAEHETLDGGDILPGFSLPLATLFVELDETGPESP